MTVENSFSNLEQTRLLYSVEGLYLDRFERVRFKSF